LTSPAIGRTLVESLTASFFSEKKWSVRVNRLQTLAMIIALVACSIGMSAAAQTPPPAAGQTAPPPSAAAARPVPAELPDVIARVNGEAINKGEFENAVKSIEQRNGGPVPADQRDRIYRAVLDQMVGYKLLIQETKTRHVEVPDAEIETRIGQIRQQFPSEDAFKQVLAQQNLTVEQLKDDARQDMAVSKLIDGEIAGKVTVKPEEVQAFYTQNPQHFRQAEKVHASHILIQVPKDADAAAKTQARAKIDDLLKQAREGKDFSELAKQNSQDPGSGPNGGDLGFFEPGQMVGPFNDAAFAQQPGTISEVVETAFGFHIIKVIEKQPAGVVPLDQAKDQIQEYLEGQGREQQTTAFVNALKAKGKVEIYI
jgi:peptidyl-prolyl cis-trans isomerase C